MSAERGFDLSALRGARVALLGAGIDVLALVDHLTACEPASATVYVDVVEGVGAEARARLDAAGVDVRPIDALRPGAADVVVRSPGFNRYRPELAAWRDDGRMTTPIDLWLWTHGASHVVTLVTGTKGKSTTTSCLAALLSPLAPIVMGNIGVPAWSIDDEAAASARPVVCELSSFQASDTSYVADLAVLTTLDVDHVDWHGSVERYHADKLGPVERARTSLRGSPELVARLAARSDALGSFLASVPPHLASNYALAVVAAEHVLGRPLDDGAAITTLGAVEALPGRQRTVGRVRGVEAVDNALASNPLATAAALDSFAGRHVWLIVGGADRGVPLDPLADALDRRDAASVTLVAIPHSGASLAARLGDHPAIRDVVAVDSIEAAVASVTPIGADDVVVFSPTAPTPPEQGTWVDRSAAFVAAVDAASPR